MRIKGINHCVVGVAPFVGAIINAPTCVKRCKGCNAKALKKLDVINEMSANEILDHVELESENKGIILGGLEWSESPLELLELCREASKRNLSVMVQTHLELNQFFSTLGRAVYGNTKMSGLFDSKIMQENDDSFFELIGKMSFDLYVPNDYYIKTGAHDKSLPSYTEDLFGIELSSSNQKIVLIKKAVE